jgi:hypothetical protein
MKARTDKEKREIIERLYHIWIQISDIRLGQLIDNSITGGKDIFFLEDDEFVKGLERYAQDVSKNSRRT